MSLSQRTGSEVLPTRPCDDWDLTEGCPRCPRSVASALARDSRLTLSWFITVLWHLGHQPCLAGLTTSGPWNQIAALPIWRGIPFRLCPELWLVLRNERWSHSRNSASSIRRGPPHTATQPFWASEAQLLKPQTYGADRRILSVLRLKPRNRKRLSELRGDPRSTGTPPSTLQLCHHQASAGKVAVQVSQHISCRPLHAPPPPLLLLLRSLACVSDDGR
jgi:hypothetical protein